VENKDKLFYCISTVGKSIFPVVYLFNDDKLQYEQQKLHSSFVFKAKTNREIITFFLPSYLNKSPLRIKQIHNLFYILPFS